MPKKNGTLTTFLIFACVGALLFLTSCSKKAQDEIKPNVCNSPDWIVETVNFGINSQSWIDSSSCEVIYVDSVSTDTTHFEAIWGYSSDGPVQKIELYTKVLAKKVQAGVSSIIVCGQIWTNTQDATDRFTRVIGVDPLTPNDPRLKHS